MILVHPVADASVLQMDFWALSVGKYKANIAKQSEIEPVLFRHLKVLDHILTHSYDRNQETNITRLKITSK